ncbi:MAG: hypothetical protein PVF37_14730 [Desulfobacterales bacterium]|jgi:hypothetical protein
MNEKVAIVKSGGDAAEPLRDVVQQAVDLLDSPLEDIDGHSTVVIKPNITANTPVGFQTILAGTDSRIVDTICAKVMGFEPSEIDILNTSNDRWGPLDPADVKIVGETVDQIARPFKHAAECVKPPEGIECAEGGACAACAGVLELALERARQMDILERLKPLRIVFGPDSGIPDDGQNVLVVGKCLSHLGKSGRFVPG